MLSVETYPGAVELLTAVTIPHSGPPERRRSRRFLVDKVVTITVMTTSGNRAIRGAICNVSQSGIGIRMNSAIAPDSFLRVDVDSIVVFGRTMYCDAAPENQYEVGLKIGAIWIKASEKALVTRGQHHPEANSEQTSRKLLTSGQY